MGGHFMRGQFKSFDELLEDLREAKKVWEGSYHLHFEVAEIKYNRETEEYELSIYFGK